MEVDQAAGASNTQGEKRKATVFQNVDIDTGENLPSAKRGNINLNEGTKLKALKALLSGYRCLKQHILGDDKDKTPEYVYNITISNQITSIILTLHNIKRQRANKPGEIPAMEAKARKKSFTIQYKGTHAFNNFSQSHGNLGHSNSRNDIRIQEVRTK